ncbi:MAG: hypothetical protein ACE5JB_11555 [bacterium]
MKNIKFRVRIFFLFFSLLFLSLQAIAQDSNILYPIEEIEQRLIYEPFDIIRFRDSRFEGDITKRVILKYHDTMIQVKWKRSARGGRAPNNEPRYEIAAYKLQKLFLDPEDYVVPPTVGRCMPVGQYRKLEPGIDPTFKKTSDVVFVLQYWLENVTSKNIYDKKRFASDTSYARHLGNMNIFSYLIKHSDSNIGNFLISTDPTNPRVFAVDNGLAFGNLESTRGYEWRDIRLKRLPKETIDRLRGIQLEDLERTLGVVAQFEMKDGYLVPVEATQNLNKGKGVRQSNGIIQFGLTSKEIKEVYKRLNKILKRIDKGKIKTF